MSRRSLDLESVRKWLYEKQDHLCAACHQSLKWDEAQLAHRIPEALWAMKKWGPSVIDHPFNKAMTHPFECNDAMLIANDPRECEALVKLIKSAMVQGAAPWERF
jgi:hypothetical protein